MDRRKFGAHSNSTSAFVCVFHSSNKTSFFAGPFRKKNRAKIWESLAGGVDCRSEMNGTK